MNWRFWTKFKTEPKRTVILFCDDTSKIVTAKKSQSGWIARYYGNLDDQWLLLCKDGTIYPRTWIRRWAPHSGWLGTETFPLLEDQNKRGI